MLKVFIGPEGHYILGCKKPMMTGKIIEAMALPPWIEKSNDLLSDEYQQKVKELEAREEKLHQMLSEGKEGSDAYNAYLAERNKLVGELARLISKSRANALNHTPKRLKFRVSNLVSNPKQGELLYYRVDPVKLPKKWEERMEQILKDNATGTIPVAE